MALKLAIQRELALVLERNRDLNRAVPPDTDAFPTLAEELSAWRIRYGGKENTLQQNFPPTTAKRILRVLYSETLDVWTDLTNLKREPTTVSMHHGLNVLRRLLLRTSSYPILVLDSPIPGDSGDTVHHPRDGSVPRKKPREL